MEVHQQRSQQHHLLAHLRLALGGVQNTCRTRCDLIYPAASKGIRISTPGWLPIVVSTCSWKNPSMWKETDWYRGCAVPTADDSGKIRVTDDFFGSFGRLFLLRYGSADRHSDSPSASLWVPFILTTTIRLHNRQHVPV